MPHKTCFRNRPSRSIPAAGYGYSFPAASLNRRARLSSTAKETSGRSCRLVLKKQSQSALEFALIVTMAVIMFLCNFPFDEIATVPVSIRAALDSQDIPQRNELIIGRSLCGRMPEHHQAKVERAIPMSGPFGTTDPTCFTPKSYSLI